jgi:ABC-type sugar transport system ATPase subunit
MNHGEILQIARPNEVYARPVNLFVAQFVGEMNFVKAEVIDSGQVGCSLGKLPIPIPNRMSKGANITLAIRPEHVKVLPMTSNSANHIAGKITSKNYLGDSALLEVEVNGTTLLAKLDGDTELSMGDSAAVEFPAHRWHVFP